MKSKKSNNILCVFDNNKVYFNKIKNSIKNHLNFILK